MVPLTVSRASCYSGLLSMPPPAQHVTPPELAALEHAFATDPGSNAYRQLTEAYLGMGRFMEAMVVCRKGIKGHPTDPAPRVLLARIYAAQNRDAKALEELNEALKLARGDIPALRMLGALRLKAGDRDAGIAALRTAWEGAPDDAETLAAMKRYAVSFASERVAAPRAAAPSDPTSAPAVATARAAAQPTRTTPVPVLARGPVASSRAGG